MHLGHTRDPHGSQAHRLAVLLLVGLGLFMGTIAGLAAAHNRLGTVLVAGIGGLVGYFLGRLADGRAT